MPILSLTQEHAMNRMPLTEGTIVKGGRNPPNTSDLRPPAPKGSGETDDSFDEAVRLGREVERLEGWLMELGHALFGTTIKLPEGYGLWVNGRNEDEGKKRREAKCDAALAKLTQEDIEVLKATWHVKAEVR